MVETLTVLGVTPFVGRNQEFHEIDLLIDEALGGRGTAVMLVGEPGIGKTRLAEELAAAVASRGVVAAWGSSWEGSGQPAFWPWTQVLRSLATTLGDSALDRPQWASEAVRPLWGSAGSHQISTTDPAAAENARFALFDGLTEVLRTTAESHPLLIVLDDVHWADPASVLCLGFLIRQLRNMPVVVLGTLRKNEASASTSNAALSGLPIRHVVLGGLSSNEVGELVAATGNDTISADVASWIHEQTSGNPLFATELTRLVTRHGRRGINESVIANLSELIQQRIQGFSLDCQAILQAAAVLGTSFDVRELQDVTRIDAPKVFALLDIPIGSGLLIREDARCCAFAHPLVREVLEREMALSDRVRLHEAAALALEQTAAAKTPVGLTRLARHFREAVSAGYEEKARWYCVSAARQALTRLAFEEAATQLTSAIEISSSSLAVQERIELLLLLGDARAKAGSNAAAVAAFEQARDLANMAGSAEQFAAAVLGCCLGNAAYEARPDVVLQLERALKRVPADQLALRARLTGQLATQLANHSGTTVRRVELASSAVAMARQTGDYVVIAEALTDSHNALWTPEHIADRPAAADEVLAFAAETGNDDLAALGRMWEFTAHLDLGHRQELDRALGAYAKVANRLRRPLHRANLLGRRAMLASVDGRFEEARRLADQRAQIAFEAGLPEAAIVRPSHELDIGLEHINGDGFAQAVSEMGRLDENHRAIVFRACVPAMLAVMGREQDARRALLSWVERIADLANYWSATAMLVTLARAAGRLNEPDAAQAIYYELLPHRSLVGSIAGGNHCVGPAALGLAMTATVIEKWDEADEHFGEARAMAQRMGSRSWEARTAFEQARMLIRRGGRGGHGNREQAIDLLARASAIANELDMNVLLDEVGAVSLGQSIAGAASTRAAPVAALQLEGDVWTVRRGDELRYLKDAKGLHYLAALIPRPNHECHALELVALTDGASLIPGLERRNIGDAGVVLDATTKHAYRQRIADLQDDLGEATAFNDPERASKAQTEIDALVSELEHAVGLGGRDRKGASTAERARLNVTRAIRSAIDRVTEVDAILGTHLDCTIRTGTFCVYDPGSASSEFHWEIRP